MTQRRRQNSPGVTIVIPAYKIAAFLAEAIDSALAQTYPHVEIIVVDQDCDATMDAVLAPYGERVRRLALDKPSLSGARNLAIRQSSREIIVQLDGDDCLEPQAVERYVSILGADHGSDAVFPNAVMFGMPEVEGVRYQDVYPAYRPVTFEDVVRRRTNIFGAMAYTRSAVESVGLFDEAIRYAEDFDLWLRMLQAGLRIDFTEEVLYRYRRRPDAMCAGASLPKLESLLSIHEKSLSGSTLTGSQRAALAEKAESLRAEIALERGKEMIRRGDYRQSREQIRIANRTIRSAKLSIAEVGLRVARLVAKFLGSEPQS